MRPSDERKKILMSLTGQEWLVVKHQLLAIYDNILSWLLVILRVRTSRLVLEPLAKPAHAAAVQIVQPGGYESFRQVDLDAPAANGDVLATVGYNVQAGVERVDGCASLVRVALDGSRGLPPACVLVAIDSFSVNYADVTIRWGLYESAIRYVGYPIVPGFDFAGTVLAAGAEASVAVGARVMGVTFFGGYSQRLVVPSSQLRPVPAAMSQRDAAALSSVAGTALHSLALAGFWPGAPLTANRAVLIHSAAGGVGSMLVQMAKLLGCAPVVAVVGAPHKMAACHALGAHVVIDKSSADLWTEAARAAPTGFAAVFDANGVATLAQSYHALSKTGRLIVYGFHTNLPSTGLLNPLAWLRMAVALFRLPRFDPLDLVLNSKSVHGFNLSFFADEAKLLEAYMDQVFAWASEGKLVLPKLTCYGLREVPLAHELIQSGQSVGKIVCSANQEQRPAQPPGETEAAPAAKAAPVAAAMPSAKAAPAAMATPAVAHAPAATATPAAADAPAAKATPAAADAPAAKATPAVADASATPAELGPSDSAASSAKPPPLVSSGSAGGAQASSSAAAKGKGGGKAFKRNK